MMKNIRFKNTKYLGLCISPSDGEEDDSAAGHGPALPGPPGLGQVAEGRRHLHVYRVDERKEQDVGCLLKKKSCWWPFALL